MLHGLSKLEEKQDIHSRAWTWAINDKMGLRGIHREEQLITEVSLVRTILNRRAASHAE